MRAFICDRCGNMVVNEGRYTQVGTVTRLLSSDAVCGGIKGKEICTECAEKLAEWLKGTEGNEES